MSAPIPTIEPTSFAAGDSLSWTKSLADYSANDGWSLLYCFRGKALSTLDLTSTASGSDHLLSLTTTATENLLPGKYTVAGYAQKTGERVQIFLGTITVTQNLYSTIVGEDTRSPNRITLDNIEAVIQGRASSSVLNSTVNGTRLERVPIADLLKLRDYYASLVASEGDAELISQGKKVDRRIIFQFS